MSVYVDRLTMWPTKIRCFKAGSCHMWADSLDELHAMAKRLGLKREWFQPHRVANHYDLTATKRAKAIELGALEWSMKTWIWEQRTRARIRSAAGEGD